MGLNKRRDFSVSHHIPARSRALLSARESFVQNEAARVKLILSAVQFTDL
jgi:hypothetical protein